MLELSAPEALGRASFAAASVAAASAGHFGLAASHCDVSNQVIAFIVLLFATRLTRRLPGLLVASLLAQVLVHGGIPLHRPDMLSLHLIAAILTLGLLHHSEDIWRALADIVVGRIPELGGVPTIAMPSLGATRRSEFVTAFIQTVVPKRGPPVFA